MFFCLAMQFHPSQTKHKREKISVTTLPCSIRNKSVWKVHAGNPLNNRE